MLLCLYLDFVTVLAHLSEQEVSSFSSSAWILTQTVLSPDVTMAARFSLSSESDSEPSEELEEGERGSFPMEQDRQAPPRHTLTLPELRIAGKKQ